MLDKFKSLLIALLAVSLTVPSAAFADIPFAQTVGTLVHTNDTVSAPSLQGASACIIEVSGAWSGVITPEAVVNNTWFTAPVYAFGSSTAVTTITANGEYTLMCAALRGSRVRFSTATSGVASITINSSQGSVSKTTSSGGGGVVSVTGSPNTHASTSAGAVTLSDNQTPRWDGPVTIGTVGADHSGYLELGAAVGNGMTQFSSQNGAPAIAGVVPTALDISSSIGYLAINQFGDVGVQRFVSSGALASAVGNCVQIGTSGRFTDSGAACGGGGGGSAPVFVHVYPQAYLPGSGGGNISNQAYTTQPPPIAPGFVIGHIALACSPYNDADAAVGNSFYNQVDANGLGGATVTFAVIDSTNSYSAPLVLGSVVIPDSPLGGPYVTSGVTTVSTPYTSTTNSSVVVQVTNTSTTASQAIGLCVPMIST